MVYQKRFFGGGTDTTAAPARPLLSGASFRQQLASESYTSTTHRYWTPSNPPGKYLHFRKIDEKLKE